MAQIEVDLDDFDTIDLIEEVTKRLRRNRKYALTPKQIKRVVEEMEELNAGLNVLVLPITSIDDLSKKETVLTYWGRYTSSQFEDKLK